MDGAAKALGDEELKTIEDWMRLPEDVNASLINGTIYLQAAPSPKHGMVQGNIRAAIDAVICKEYEPDGALPRGKWIFVTEVGVAYGSSVCRHDLAGWRTETIGNQSLANPSTLRPDWVCEIISTNAMTDLVRKRALLEKHQVPYYWAIDPEERLISVLKLNANAYELYAEVEFSNEPVRLPPFEDVEFKPSALFFYPPGMV